MIRIGDKYNRLVVIGEGEPYVSKSGKSREKTYKCVCDCGAVKTVRGSYLKGGRVKSCGCLVREMSSQVHMKHGGKGTRLYGIWKSMRERCKTTTSSNYERYGARGVEVCCEWDDFALFREWSLANGYKDGLTIDRIDVNGNYEPSNCRWATYQEQANNMRSNRWIERRGERSTMAQFCRDHHLKYKYFSSLLCKGYTVEEAMEKAAFE